MHLVPLPRTLKRGAGAFNLERARARVSIDTTPPACIRHKLAELGLTAHWQCSSALPTITLGTPLKWLPQPPRRAEGYWLLVTPRGVSLVGRDLDGLFWGLTTLQQLIDEKGRVPSVTITDWPAFRLRYHHDDISRKQVSRLGDFKRIIRLLSYYKIKYYTPYMEDMLYLESYPDIGEGRGRLTASEVKAIHAEARRYNVVVFPTYSLIGHQENLLRNPRYRRYAREVFQEPSSYDPSKRSLRPYLRRVIGDVCALFPDSPYFHACFDETQGVGERELVDHANWCAAEIARHGKTMLMWVDMFKNHYGLGALNRLSPNILPVEWNYDAPRLQEDGYREAGVIPAGLAGYNNWACFLPDFRRGKRNIDQWAGVMKRWKGPGFGASIWGDNGYENSRDLCWNLYAYLGEAVWRGTKAAPSFEQRFEATFYGTPLPRIQAIVEQLPPKLTIEPRHSWRLFRYSIQAMIRLCAVDSSVATHAAADLKLLRRALGTLPTAARWARREQGHPDHFAVALEREINVRERLVFANRIARGTRSESLRHEARKQRNALERVRRHYRQVWLRHNKRENIEVSLAVYDRIRESLKSLTTQAPAANPHYLCLDLDEHYNTFLADVAGLPIRRGMVNDTPFLFAPQAKTHCSLELRTPLTIPFARCAPRDIHLIYGGQTIDRKRPRAVVEVALLCGGKVVFRERLRSITQICDWWAPLGEHIWAGGGLKYVDKRRTSYGLQPGENYGVLHLHGFDLREVAEADTLRITRIAREQLNLFAVTVQRR